MEQLLVYKNYDTFQHEAFTGRTVKSVLAKLHKWLDNNNGEFDSRYGYKAVYADGAMLDTGEGHVTLVWDECYENWQIEYEDGILEDFDTWAEARDQFIKVAKSYVI